MPERIVGWVTGRTTALGLPVSWQVAHNCPATSAWLKWAGANASVVWQSPHVLNVAGVWSGALASVLALALLVRTPVLIATTPLWQVIQAVAATTESAWLNTANGFLKPPRGGDAGWHAAQSFDVNRWVFGFGRARAMLPLWQVTQVSPLTTLSVCWKSAGAMGFHGLAGLWQTPQSSEVLMCVANLASTGPVEMDCVELWQETQFETLVASACWNVAGANFGAFLS